ncbi:MAG: asparagine synthase-related protein [Candidatus Pacearchaeota archaeon]|jgi:asparagine synthase (glutamine-hydrolysing)
MHDEKYYLDKLKVLLGRSVKKLIDGKNPADVAVALSGGIDSTIIAKVLKNHGVNKAYVIGVEGCHDLLAAEQVAEELGSDLKKIILSEKDVEENLLIQARILKKLYEENEEKIKPETPKTKLNPVSVSSNFMLFFVEKFAKEKYIFSGLGADTLLAGFAKYFKLNESEAIKQVKKESRKLLRFDYLEDVATAKFFGKKILMPFLEKEVSEFCIDIPYKLKFNKRRKYILRKLGLELGLSEEASFRKKKSAQYGTGIMKLMKRVAKKNNMHISDYVQTC